MWSIDACLYSCCFTFPLVFLFPLSLSNFSFFFLYFLLSSFLHLAFLPPPLFIVHGYPLFVPFVIVGFTPFVPQPFLASCGISLRLPTHLLVIQPLPLPKVCWLHHSPFPDKITCLVSYFSLFWFYLNG